MGGKPSAPTVEEKPEVQATKSVTASAQQAADDQRERAKKNKGLKASIMTVRNAAMESAVQGKTTLG